MYNTEWFMIPGFRCYEINIRTREVRSLKHPYKMCFHIMQGSKLGASGKITIVDDFGKPRKTNVNDLYELTFNSGIEPEPRGENEVWLNAMNKGCRNMNSNIDILKGTITVEEETKDESVVLDFSKIMNEPVQLIKPFNITIN